MKKLITLFMTTAVAGFITAQNVTFDGTALEDALLNHTPPIDTDSDGVISIAEAQAFSGTLNVSYKDLTNHVGLEEFVNITELNISGNKLTSLNVSANNNLETLNCSYQDYTMVAQGILTSLTLGSNSNLKTVNADGNALTFLNTQGCPNLEELRLYDNSLGSLFLSNNTALKYLDIANDMAGQNDLYALNISNSPIEFLRLSRVANINNLIGLEGKTTLKKLLVDGCAFINLDLSTNTNLEELNAQSSPNLIKLNVKNGNNNPTLAILNAALCPNLACIEVDDVAYSTGNSTWVKDSTTTYNTDCPNPCTPISGLTVNSVQAGNVTISWTPGGTENEWHVQVGSVGYTPGSGQQMMNGFPWGIGNTTNYQIGSTMTPNTTYDIYVRANCGSGVYSDWGTPLTFTTAATCEEVAGVSVSAVTNNSVTVSITPGDATQNWWEYKIGLPGFEPDVPGQTVTGIATGDTSPTMSGLIGNTAYEVRVRTNCGSGIFSGWSAPVPFTTLPCEDVTGVSTSNVTSFTVDVSWTAGSTETNWDIEYGPTGFATGTGTAAFAFNTPQRTITGLTPGTAYDVRIRSYCGWQNYGAWVNQTFTTAAPCSDITGLSTSNASTTSVDIAWTAGGSETSWDIEYGPQGYTQGSDAGTIITVTTNPYPLTGLIEGYAYDVYVRSNCGGGSIGNWDQASFSTTGTPCIVNIPDANFKAALVGNPMINTNGDTEIQCYEAAAYAGYLSVYGQGIADLTGIEAFVNMTNFDAGSNDLTAVDLSQNTKLIMLYLDWNQLTSLDVSALADLEYLYCQNNFVLSTLDVSQNSSLQNLDCNFNQIETLNVSNNGSLTNLQCQNNALTHLNVKNGNNISLFIMATENPDLNCIEVDDVAWSTANWSNNVDNPVAFSEDCFTVSVEQVVMAPMSVRLYPNPFSDVITITSDQNLIESVKVYDLKGMLLYQMRDNSTEVNVNLSNLSSGIYLIKTASQNGETMHKVVKK